MVEKLYDLIFYYFLNIMFVTAVAINIFIYTSYIINGVHELYAGNIHLITN